MLDKITATAKLEALRKKADDCLKRQMRPHFKAFAEEIYESDLELGLISDDNILVDLRSFTQFDVSDLKIIGEFVSAKIPHCMINLMADNTREINGVFIVPKTFKNKPHPAKPNPNAKDWTEAMSKLFGDARFEGDETFATMKATLATLVDIRTEYGTFDKTDIIYYSYDEARKLL